MTKAKTAAGGEVTAMVAVQMAMNLCGCLVQNGVLSKSDISQIMSTTAKHIREAGGDEMVAADFDLSAKKANEGQNHG